MDKNGNTMNKKSVRESGDANSIFKDRRRGDDNESECIKPKYVERRKSNFQKDEHWYLHAGILSNES